MQKNTITASRFKAQCLKLMDEVNRTGEEIIITKNGKPVSKLTPVSKKPASLFGAHKSQIEITGDIVSPLDVDWEAMQ